MSNEHTRPCLLTIGTCNRRASISVVARSFLRYHPNGQVYIYLADRPDPRMSPLDLPGEVFLAEQLPLPGGRRFLFKYTAFELCCALKPYAIKHALQRSGVTHLVYLDSDVLVISPFWNDLEAAWRIHPILLTPHLIRLPLDLSPEAQRSLLQHGTCNAGFLAVKHTTDSFTFLDWWGCLLDTHCTFDPMNNVSGDQRWLDLAASSSPAVGILRDPGLNVGYWNLHERALQEETPGKWRCNGKPLKFFHFSGFDRQRLTTKVHCSDPVAMRISDHYGAVLEDSGDLEFRRFPYGWKSYSNGDPIPLQHRDLILGNHPDLQHVADPFSLPEMQLEWDTIQRLGTNLEPFRIGHRFKQSQALIAEMQQLHRHPVIGRILKLWTRYINPALAPSYRTESKD